MSDPIQPSSPPPVVHAITHVADTLSTVPFCGAPTADGALGTEDPERVTCRDCDPAAPSTVQQSITVRQDVGGHYPSYKYVTLDLHTDGAVTWRDLTYDH